LIKVDNLAEILEEPLPFGPVDPENLAGFEKEIDRTLPSEFREYLLRFNGALFKKDIYVPSEDAWDATKISHVHGLHDGPDYFQLVKQWKLYEKYDLQTWKWKLEKFVVFADSEGGDLFAINTENGSVWLYLHDCWPEMDEMSGSFTKIENSFNEFLLSLQSEEEYDVRMMADPRHEEFKRRLAKIEFGSGAKKKVGLIRRIYNFFA